MKSKNALPIVGVVLILGLAIFGAYEYGRNRDLSNRLEAEIGVVHRQVAALADAIQESDILGQENKKLSEELARINAENRKEIEALTKKTREIPVSQDQLVTSAVAKASPAVVSVIVSKDIPQVEIVYVNPFSDRDIGLRVPVYRQVGTKKETVGGGSGFIITRDGYIVTNRHVVSDHNAEYTVLLSNGDQKTAQVFHRDDTTDLALLKIEGSKYPVLSLGNSLDLKLGQSVAAIGNALGEYNNSVSIGIISGLNRTIQARDSSGQVETLTGVIQTDAAINRGNSGGPLIDLAGNAIGVNVAVQGGANSIGFSIPINAVRALINRVL